MKIKTLLVCGFVLALAGMSSVVVAEGAKTSAQATVRAIHGTATYSVNGGPSQPLRPNMTLDEMTTIETGPDTTVDLQVNGKTSVVRVTANSKMTLKTMTDLGAGDSNTMLDVKNGQILGFVKKISKDSKYEVNTPRGVAGIRGTDFAVTVSQNADGTYNVTFTSVTGQVFVVANVNVAGVPTSVPKTLTTGESWTPPISVTSTSDSSMNVTTALANIIAAYQVAKADNAPLLVSLGLTPTPPTPVGPGTPGNITVVIPIINPTALGASIVVPTGP